MVIQISILTVDAEHELTHDKPKNRFEFFYDRWKMLFRLAKLWNALAKLQEENISYSLKSRGLTKSTDQSCLFFSLSLIEIEFNGR